MVIHKKIIRYKYNFDSSFFIFGYTYRLLGCRFVWSKPFCVVDGMMRMVRCKICMKIKERKKLLVPKFYSLIKHSRLRKWTITSLDVATLTWPSVGVKPNTWKSWDWESTGTPECSELDSKEKNTSHWGVLGVIGKVLKRRYRKCPRIGNSDIFSPSYGQKKGRESNWQFDSRPLKVGNRCLPDIRIGSAIRRWKDLDKGYDFGSDLIAIQLCSRELWRFEVPGVLPRQFRDSISGVPGIYAIRM
jgi:hypothetical protein